MSTYSLIENRTIRVFISSTFQDMQDERSELIRKTFPRLRELAARRDVTLTEVDLRWGITKEESESGKVMEICLREVQNSIPFFIGIIGNRYGWIPGAKDISDIVKERFPDVPGYVKRQLSATEIEMQFGVLDSQENMNAYFFIKEEETADIDDPQKLAALKKAVRENKKYPVSTYQNPEDLADQVLVAFTKLLDDLFPVGELSALEKERLGQRAVLNNLTRVYIKNEANFAVIDEWMKDWEKHQLVITGESGMGKSALVANWVKEMLDLGDALPYRIIYHFVGYGGSVGSDWHVVNSLCGEIRDQYGFDEEGVKEMEDEGLRDRLGKLFKRVRAEGDKPLLIVLDGVDQITGRFAKSFTWLPYIPEKIKILFTTTQDDETEQTAQFRRYPIYPLHPLTESERIQMVTTYLDKTYSKHLQDYQLKKIVKDSQNENTLVLKTLLDEVAHFGRFEELDKKIDEYLKPDSIGDYYQVVLQNYEVDFGEALIRDYLSLIIVSRNGLSEDEILQITGTKDKPILWSQFYCSFRQHMIVKNGLVSFAHSYIRKAIGERYLKDKDDWVRSCRERIISAFENENTLQGKKTAHSMEELPYQFIKLKDISRLYHYVIDPEVFKYLNNTDSSYLEQCWHILIEHGHSMRDYLCLIDEKDKEEYAAFLRELDLVALGLTMTPMPSPVVLEHRLQLQLDILDIYRKSFGDEHPKVINMYDQIGNTFRVKDDNQKALEYLNKALDIKKKLFGSNHSELASSYEALADIYLENGDADKALALTKKALAINSNLSVQVRSRIHHNLQEVIRILDESDKYQEELDWALKLLDFKIKEYGNNDEVVANSYHEIGYLYERECDYQHALEYYLKSLDIRLPLLGDNASTTTDVEIVLETYLDIADIYGRLEEKEKEDEYLNCVSRITDNKRIIASVFCRRGDDYRAIGDIEKAKEYFDKALDVYIELDNEDAINFVLKQMDDL